MKKLLLVATALAVLVSLVALALPASPEASADPPGGGGGGGGGGSEPAATALTVSEANGPYGGTVNLQATLKSGNSKLKDKTVSFTLNGVGVGDATTNNQGKAELENVSLNGIDTGVYPTGIEASFAGDDSYSESNGTAKLTVTQLTPAITWSDPDDIAYGTALSDTQLNATANVDGTFNYNPPTGTVLDQGKNQDLCVEFTPTDTVNYKSASECVKIDVVESETPTETPKRAFCAEINPKTADTGEPKDYTITFTAGSDNNAPIGYLTAVIPSGFTGVSISSVTASDDKSWSSEIDSGKIVLTSIQGNDNLNAGEYVSVSFTATAPGSTGDYIWTANAYTGKGIGSAFDITCSQPTVTVSQAPLPPTPEPTYTLTYSAGAGGSIDGDKSQIVNEGEDGKPVTAVPDDCYHFIKWSDDSTENPRTDKSVDSDITVEAIFAITQYNIDVTQGDHGTISPDNNMVAGTYTWLVLGTYKWLVLGIYSHDLFITEQNPDGTFSGTGGYPAGASPYALPGQTTETITGRVTGNQITFTTKYAGPYNPGYTATASGTIYSDGSMRGNSPWEWHTTSGAAKLAVNCGADQTFTITADDCYHVADVLVDGESVGAVTSYTFENVVAEHAITATFAINTYTITVTQSDHGAISPDPATVACGASQIFTITPDTDYHVATLTVDGSPVTPAESYTFNNVREAGHTITATFAKAITVTADSGQTKVYGTADPTFTYSCSDPAVTFTGALSRVAGEDVDTYAITQGTLDAGTNYTITFVSADFTITKADATINVVGWTGTYDGDAHGATGSATGVGGVPLSGLDLGPSFTNVPGGTMDIHRFDRQLQQHRRHCS